MSENKKVDTQKIAEGVRLMLEGMGEDRESASVDVRFGAFDEFVACVSDRAARY